MHNDNGYPTDFVLDWDQPKSGVKTSSILQTTWDVDYSLYTPSFLKGRSSYAGWLYSMAVSTIRAAVSATEQNCEGRFCFPIPTSPCSINTNNASIHVETHSTPFYHRNCSNHCLFAAMDPYMLQGIRKFSGDEYLNDDEVEAENKSVLPSIPVKAFGLASNAEYVQNFDNSVVGGGKRLPPHPLPQSPGARRTSAKWLPPHPLPQPFNTFENQIIRKRSSSLEIDKMSPDNHSNMLMGGLERISYTYSQTHPRMPLPPAELLQTDPLKYLKTYLVLIRPQRMRESEMDYAILESNPLITVSHLKQAIAWISAKLIAIMNENAELERQVKHLGPRRTKVLGADVYQPITMFKMAKEEWRGTDFAFCLKEATKRLPKEEIKNTRFLARLQRSPLNGQAAKCALQTTAELGLSYTEWLTARCVASDGTRMEFFSEPVESLAIRNHAMALTSSSSSATDMPTNAKRSRAARPKAGGGATTANVNSNSAATSSRKTMPRSKKRNSVAANLDNDELAGDSGDHTSDEDFAQQQPPRKKSKPSHTTRRASTGGHRHKTAVPTTSTSNSNSAAGSASAAHGRRRQESQRRLDDDYDHDEDEEEEDEADEGRHSNVIVCPSTPAGKMIQVKDEIYSSC
ncbi:hypothetical protein IWZ00DRAFT_88901 [Phyllosticta capitalensis]